MQTKRAKLVGKQQFQIERVEFPSVRGNPIIKVEHVGICGSDVHFWDLGDTAGKDIVLGHEYTGVIVDPGDTGFKAGDRVLGYTQNPGNDSCGVCPSCLKGDFEHCTNRAVHVSIGCHTLHPGAYSEYVTWYPSGIFRLPDSVSSDKATLTEPLAVGLHAVGLSEIKPGSKVLILGGGIIGCSVAEWARIFCAEVLVMTELNPAKADMIRSFKIVDNVYAADAPDLEDRLRAAVHGGFDLVFDCVALPGPLNMSLKLLKRDGVCVIVGVSFDKISFDVYETVVCQKRIQGSKGHTPNDFKANLRAIEAGRIDPAKYITRRIRLDGVQSAFNVIKATGTDMKVLIDF